MLVDECELVSQVVEEVGLKENPREAIAGEWMDSILGSARSGHGVARAHGPARW